MERRAASVAKLARPRQNEIGRLWDTGLVHTASSGRRQVTDIIDLLDLARQSLPLRHATVLPCIRLFESTAKPTSSATNAVADSSAMLPVVTAQTVVFHRGFGGWFFRHYTVLLCIPLFEATAKTTSSAIKAVAVSSAMLPLVTAQTVASGRGFGGCISRRNTWPASSSRSMSKAKFGPANNLTAIALPRRCKHRITGATGTGRTASSAGWT